MYKCIFLHFLLNAFLLANYFQGDNKFTDREKLKRSPLSSAQGQKNPGTDTATKTTFFLKLLER